MRRIALLGLTLLLPACSGFDTFVNDTHWFGRPNQPVGNSENMRRIRGLAAEQAPLRPEPGDVWPGPIPPQPTLEQLMREENQEIQQPPPIVGPYLNAPPAPPGHRQPRGSSTPPGPVEPGLPPLPNVPPLPEAKLPRPGARVHVYQTPQGQMTGSQGPGGYESLTTPNGEPGGIAVPNGNGTSTIIMPNGNVLTVPTPK